MQLGPEDLLVAVRLELEDGLSTTSLEHVMDELQRDVRRAVDTVRQVSSTPRRRWRLLPWPGLRSSLDLRDGRLRRWPWLWCRSGHRVGWLRSWGWCRVRVWHRVGWPGRVAVVSGTTSTIAAKPPRATAKRRRTVAFSS